MGRVLARTVVFWDDDEGRSVTYLEGAEVSDAVAAKITNPKAFAEEVEDTSEADKAAYERSSEAIKAGRPLHVLDEDERRAWAYEPDSDEGMAAEARVVAEEGGDPAPSAPSDPGDPAGDPSGDQEPATPEPPRSGKGSGVAAWRTYAEGLGYTVPGDADRDGIIAIVDAQKQ